MATSSWKGYITFGLVSLPIRLFPAARYSHIRFHEIHKSCGHRIEQQLYCPYDKEVVPRTDIVMGYEDENGQITVIDPQELKAIEPPSSTAMEIVEFVRLEEVDPLYFETSYFALPEKAGGRAYALLLATLERLKLAAIAQVTMHQRERTVIMRPYKSGLTLHTLYHQDEIHSAEGYGKDQAEKLKPQELALSQQFAKGLVEPFHPERFHDRYQERVRQLIESKRAGGGGPKAEKGKRLAPVIDLMAALKGSLAREKGELRKSRIDQAGSKRTKGKKSA